ncbi:hypothetical protein J3Q64DRAFT_1717053 [Phycomyces blakesleeanus]|uniref:Uncharacterized protein n=2 Tax=Phycomyces blakesleeanus TaxID=4837 RepID=A0A167QPX0_PHYB8|nr:hypothetical protein PHYBLDRAFT_59077 [Phycomyces blakesleeanus NRRL 1555(-)]OAD80040.1 hypothetical protein PHYBLDRAFT_59077 [Phycomyces blakesleeanus NRRL 1555(-)]|eukprot:XP_018298080.1 hypothetical protein PHYBLDRAFT_59077 [Phycomyces blakesleeanus NRRL 1555(-)]
MTPTVRPQHPTTGHQPIPRILPTPLKVPDDWKPPVLLRQDAFQLECDLEESGLFEAIANGTYNEFGHDLDSDSLSISTQQSLNGRSRCRLCRKISNPSTMRYVSPTQSLTPRGYYVDDRCLRYLIHSVHSLPLRDSQMQQNQQSYQQQQQQENKREQERKTKRHSGLRWMFVGGITLAVYTCYLVHDCTTMRVVAPSELGSPTSTGRPAPDYVWIPIPDKACYKSSLAGRFLSFIFSTQSFVMLIILGMAFLYVQVVVRHRRIF